uniref:Uncharacterized protein n=1 Tax=Anguilla anguilla TaxID=7936 RepID=A0A0E9WF10_ANGAN
MRFVFFFSVVLCKTS